MELRTSPWWLAMYVPSSTQIVKGFLYAFKIFTSKYSSISSVQCLTFQGVLPLKKFQFKHFFASYRAVHVVVASVHVRVRGSYSLILDLSLHLRGCCL